MYTKGTEYALRLLSVSVLLSSSFATERQSWYTVKNNFTLHNKWWCMTSRSDQGMKNNHEQNKLQLKWNRTTGISHFAYFHSARNYYEPWAIVPFETNFLLLKLELPERKFWGLCFKSACFPDILYSQGCRQGRRLDAEHGAPSSHAAMQRGELSQAAALHWGLQHAPGQAQRSVDAREL